jgi:SAM-dependent methyltransferase
VTEHTAAAPSSHHARYLPGMGLCWLLPIYDPLTRAIGIPAAHRELCDQAPLSGGLSVLEIGCGTGNLALQVKRSHPDAAVTGLDPDADALARARDKATRAALTLQLDHGYAEQMPYADETFDRVLSAFMFHHLAAGARLRALEEVRRVLRPGGWLHLLDFGGTRDRSDGLLARMAHRSTRLQDNFDGRIPALMRDAGLAHPEETGHRVTLLGRYSFWSASRTESP